MSDGENWLEHWLCVGRVSKKACELVESVGGKVVYLSANAGYSPGVALVCFLYDDPPDDDQGYTIDNDEVHILKIEASTADVHECDLVVYSKSEYVAPIVQQSVTDLVLVTLGEWYEMDEAKLCNQEMDERNRTARESIDKPWLPVYDGE
jgi:hypothetical protein